MKRTGIKRAAEAILAELPSVLGAYVREDVHGHPREVHLLVGPKPDVRHLSRDVRDLLEERLGVPVDQRVISIAQVSDPAPGRRAGDRTPRTTEIGAPPEPGTAPAGRRSTRLVYAGLESEKRADRLAVRVSLARGDDAYVGEAEEMDAGAGRTRAAAQATLIAIADACGGSVRLDLESVSVIRALGRDYVLVAVLAGAASLGRRPLSLAGAHSTDDGTEVAAIFASLKATNRIVEHMLRPDDA